MVFARNDNPDHVEIGTKQTEYPEKFTDILQVNDFILNSFIVYSSPWRGILSCDRYR